MILLKKLSTKLLAALLLAGSPCYAGTLGLHLKSVHTYGNYNNDNPGIYYKSENGFTVGTYYNSEYRQSSYVGRTFETRYGDFSAVLISGYQNRVLPAIVPSIKPFGGPVRVSAMLNPFGASALHFSFEGKF